MSTSAVLHFLPRPTLAGLLWQRATATLNRPSLASLLWDGLLRAVPKSKVSHSRKRMRASNKGLKDRQDIVTCSGCGRSKRMHHLCRWCLRDIRDKVLGRQQFDPPTAPKS
ncbi:MAG: hypothetical protein DHS80DRAFT_14643 [Piptocephalis tieghemiana]|nr:MAG: hypothetical protein DHS80DRAFT_14643 [Piptocephalis tieghemiana]